MLILLYANAIILLPSFIVLLAEVLQPVIVQDVCVYHRVWLCRVLLLCLILPISTIVLLAVNMLDPRS